MNLINDIEEILVTNDQIVERCEQLGKQIAMDYAGKKPIIIGLLRGAVPFMAELIKHIDEQLEIDFLDASSYDGTHSTGKVIIRRDILSDIKDRDVLFVEDIVDTGLTLSEIKKEYLKRNPKSMEVVTLLDKKEGRLIDDFKPKYVGFNIPKKFVVGFGLDYNEFYRNLPYIGVLKRSVYEK
ncbi:MAG: hypoxanthine phosphoribosyltransferase [Bacilli bacterium]|nr:hypoxanthine phosphoribosyltransferase [Acholeplasmataceae bacterium]MDY2903011.1 hypoxanthine phosphoribosyltransferase [Bacilli bacterium]